MEYIESVKIPYKQDKFYMFYKIIHNNQSCMTKITIPDYEEKAICLLKHFPYPDLVKNILLSLKLTTLKDNYILKTVTTTIEEEIEIQTFLETDYDSDYYIDNNYDSDNNYTDYYSGNETD